MLDGQKAMAGIEVKASENVMEACARTPSVKGCVLTSSLLACVWQGGSNADPSPIVDHDSWSDEAFCLDRKVLVLLHYEVMIPLQKCFRKQF